MKKFRLITVVAALALCLAALAGCSGSGFDPAALLKGNLDVLYLGEYDPDHLKTVSLTAEEAAEFYEDGLDLEADYFCYYFDIDPDLISDETYQAIIDMYKQIYQHSKYEVGSVAKNGETYLVELTVYPIDIFNKFNDEDSESFSTDFYNRLQSGEFNDMSDEEFEEAWTAGIMQKLSARLDSIDYEEAETISVQITKDTDGYYSISDNDIQRIDELIIDYPR